MAIMVALVVELAELPEILWRAHSVARAELGGRNSVVEWCELDAAERHIWTATAKILTKIGVDVLPAVSLGYLRGGRA